MSNEAMYPRDLYHMLVTAERADNSGMALHKLGKTLENTVHNYGIKLRWRKTESSSRYWGEITEFKVPAYAIEKVHYTEDNPIGYFYFALKFEIDSEYEIPQFRPGKLCAIEFNDDWLKSVGIKADYLSFDL